MVEPQLLHFVVLDITFTLTATGYIITCHTNNPCHLFMRYTTTIPQKHIKPRIVRGAVAGTYIDQCFVVFEDNEQEEPGDTYTHTFIKEPWVVCETRWFYFWGTVNGVLSPSASAIFSKHRYAPPTPIVIIIYSEGPTSPDTVDGVVYRQANSQSWAGIHDGAATHRNIADVNFFVTTQCDLTANTYIQLQRFKTTFDLSLIPVGSTILSANYHWHCLTKASYSPAHPSWALFSAPAPPYNNVLLTDYPLFGTFPLSSPTPYDFILPGDWNIFEFTPAALPLLIPGQKVSIGIREATYDAPNVQQPWFRSRRSCNIQGKTCNWPDPALHPYLKITYLGP